MAGNLQTLGFLPPLAIQGNISRSSIFPTNHALFRQPNLAATAITSLSVESRRFAIRPSAAGGSDEVTFGNPYFTCNSSFEVCLCNSSVIFHRGSMVFEFSQKRAVIGITLLECFLLAHEENFVLDQSPVQGLF